jgi:hypothetical protein
MSPTYQTPGVYVEEISTLPPSVAEIGTAIPAFLGTTTTGYNSLMPVVQEINSLREFEERFGRAPATQWKVSFNKEKGSYTIVDQTGNPVDRFSEPACLLWYAIDHYFRNGGSRCYVVSVGPANPDSPPEADQFIKGLEALKQYDEPTLIVIPEATKLRKLWATRS